MSNTHQKFFAFMAAAAATVANAVALPPPMPEPTRAPGASDAPVDPAFVAMLCVPMAVVAVAGVAVCAYRRYCTASPFAGAAGATVYDGHAYAAMDQDVAARAATTVVEMTPRTAAPGR